MRFFAFISLTYGVFTIGTRALPQGSNQVAESTFRERCEAWPKLIKWDNDNYGVDPGTYCRWANEHRVTAWTTSARQSNLKTDGQKVAFRNCYWAALIGVSLF
jgi:hypothetical protein